MKNLKSHEESVLESQLIEERVLGPTSFLSNSSGKFSFNVEKIARLTVALIICDIGYGSYLWVAATVKLAFASSNGQLKYNTHDELGNPIQIPLTKLWWIMHSRNDFKRKMYPIINMGN
ncbi:hypothetical protein [Bdellovibrio sp. HCB209]|uniref:hypothetical protein n=1 Tax=Bdellovibrio sp. HCB209 TaxID=3394354 RepID=UPI0039B61641